MSQQHAVNKFGLAGPEEHRSELSGRAVNIERRAAVSLVGLCGSFKPCSLSRPFAEVLLLQFLELGDDPRRVPLAAGKADTLPVFFDKQLRANHGPVRLAAKSATFVAD